MKAYVISLARLENRRREVSQEFARLGIPFEWFDGCDWKLLTQEHFDQVDRRARANYGKRPLQLSEVGIALSHRGVIAKIAESPEPFAAVFEDDIGLEDEVGQVLMDLEAASEEFDLVFLHRIYSIERFVPVKPVSATHELGIVKHKDNGLQGYVITKAAAIRYLQRCPKIVHPIDMDLQSYWNTGLRSYTLNPPAVKVRWDPKESVRLEAPYPDHRLTIVGVLRKVYIQLRDACWRRIVFRRRLRSERHKP